MDALVQQLERHTRALVPSFRQVQYGTTNRSGCSMGHDATSSGSTRTLPGICPSSRSYCERLRTSRTIGGESDVCINEWGSSL
jgi:hypothetical protein